MKSLLRSSDSLTTTNATQSTFDPAIATLMASIMANAEVMYIRLEELDAERRNGGG